MASGRSLLLFATALAACAGLGQQGSDNKNLPPDVVMRSHNLDTLSWDTLQEETHKLTELVGKMAQEAEKGTVGLEVPVLEAAETPEDEAAVRAKFDVQINALEANIAAMRQQYTTNQAAIQMLTSAASDNVLFSTAHNFSAVETATYEDELGQVKELRQEFRGFNQVITSGIDRIVQLMESRLALEKEAAEQLPELASLSLPSSLLPALRANQTDLTTAIAAAQQSIAHLRANATAASHRSRLLSLSQSHHHSVVNNATQRSQQHAQFASTYAGDLKQLQGLLASQATDRPSIVAEFDEVRRDARKRLKGSVDEDGMCTQHAWAAEPHARLFSHPLGVAATTLSVAMFVRPAQTPRAPLFAITALVQGEDAVVVLSDNCTALSLLTPRDSHSIAHLPASICNGGWHHVVVTWSSVGGECVVYVDGVFRGHNWGVMPAVTMPPASVLTVGAFHLHTHLENEGEALNGLVRDVVLTTNMMAPDHVVALAHSRTFKPRSPYLRWSLNQPSGNQVEDSGTLKVAGLTQGGEWVTIREPPSLEKQRVALTMEEIVVECADRTAEGSPATNEESAAEQASGKESDSNDKSKSSSDEEKKQAEEEVEPAAPRVYNANPYSPRSD